MPFGRTHLDAHHVRYLSSSAFSFVAVCVGVTLGGGQFALELAHGLGVDAVVDCLV